MAVQAALIMAGHGLQAWSKIQASRNQADLARRKAAFKLIERDEILRRSKVNIETVRREGEQLKGLQSLAFAKGGVTLEGAPMSVIMNTAQQVRREVTNITTTANFRAAQAEREAAILRQQASNVEEAGLMGAFSSIFSGASSFAMMSDPNSGNIQGL
jgi:hypothetical protein